MSIEDPPDLVMLTDMNERNTGTPRGSSYSHSPDGLLWLEGQIVTPEEAGSDGGYSALNDGSVRWVRVSEMGAFAALFNGERQGFWYDSPAYD